MRTALGWAPFDDEGRYLEARYGNLSVVSLYVPSGSSGEERQAFKFKVMEWFKPVLDGWLASGRDYVLCGDWNIVRSRLDIKNWTSNQKNSGCLPAERDWLNGVLRRQQRGWVDTYRALHPEGEDYTWWSNRGAARAKNVGWRIDYQIVHAEPARQGQGVLDRAGRRAFPTTRRTPWTTPREARRCRRWRQSLGVYAQPRVARCCSSASRRG